MLDDLKYSLTEIGLKLVPDTKEWHDHEVRYVRGDNPHEIILFIHSSDYFKVCRHLKSGYSFISFDDEFDKGMIITKPHS